MEILKGVQVSDNTKKYILIAGGLAVAGLATWLIVRYFQRKKYQQSLFGGGTEYQSVVQEISKQNEVSQVITQQATISTQKAKQLANQIKSAWGGMGNDDEEAVYQAIQQINNQSDWLMVVNAYGINSAVFADRDLVADLKYRLSESEYQNCVKMLQNKGIEID